MTKRRKKTAETAGASPPKRKRKRRKAAKRRKARAPKRRKRSSARRRRSSSPRRRSSSRGRGFKFEVQRVKLDRQGYDARGKYWGANTRDTGKLYLVRVIDRATDIYSDHHVRAHTAGEAKAKTSADMVRGVSSGGGAFHSSPSEPLADAVFGKRARKHDIYGMHTDSARRERLLERERHAISHSKPMRRHRHANAHDQPFDFYLASDDDLNHVFNDPSYVDSHYRTMAALHLRARAMAQRGDHDQARRLEAQADRIGNR